VEIDWATLRRTATEVMWRAYAPYSRFPVGAAGLVDDGRVVVGCNVENASYGVTLCAECGLVSALHATGGGRLVALSCVDGDGAPLLPCGRCRQLLWESGGPTCLVDAADGPLTMVDLLPHAFDANDLAAAAAAAPNRLPARVREYQGRGTVFVHPDIDAGRRVWTAYWERSGGDPKERAGILEEGTFWVDVADAVAWGRLRTPRVVVVDADGKTSWAGDGEPPRQIGARWTP